MKKSVHNLAIFGGEPLFTQKLHVGRPNIGDRTRLLDRFDTILDQRWLTNNGPYVQEFEARIEELLGVKHCIAMCNATVALEIALRACGLTGEVIVPSFTFIATAHALQWQEITPVFCDIDPRTHNLDPHQIERLITPRTSGLLGVHLWGRPCQVEALEEVCERHNLTLMFDAAHAFGCSYKGKMVGNFGKAEVFSFHATKFINSFEGGAVTTNDDELATKIRLMQNFGFAGYDHVVYLGTNGKMNEVSAAMGLTSLENISDFISTNQANYYTYLQELRNIPGLKMALYDESEKCNYQYIILEVDESILGIGRDSLVDILWAENVLARRYFFPGCHRMEPYKSFFPNAGLLLAETERLSTKVLALPTGTGITSDQIKQVCGLIKFVAENSQLIQSRYKQLK